MESSTKILRRLLDERGVEWRGGLPTETMVEADGLDLLYVALPDGRVRAFIRNYLTPEQAIEATLGRGECEMVCSREYIESLQTENAKLRELVDYMTPIAWYAASERERDRMRDLGIEVDG